MLGNVASRAAARNWEETPASSAETFRQLTVVLIIAALTEALLLRGAVRVGVHLPKDAAVRVPFEAASAFGSLAFNFASILAIGLVAWLIGSMALRMRSALARSALLTLVISTLSGLVLTVVVDRPAADMLFGVAVVMLVCGLVAVAIGEGRLTPPAIVATVIVAAAYASYQYYALGYVFYRLIDYAAVPPLSMAALRLGEILALAGALAAFWAWGLPRWRRIGGIGAVIITGVVLLLTLAALSPASTVSILALWTSGFSLMLPWPLYSLALGLCLATVAACWRSDDGLWLGVGLLFVLLAGYMAESTYHHLLLLLGVAFLTGQLDPSPSRELDHDTSGLASGRPRGSRRAVG